MATSSSGPRSSESPVSEQAHEHKSLVLRFASDDARMQERLDEELGSLGRDGWELVAFTTQCVPGRDELSILHTFAFRRVPRAGPRSGG
jgi:hypothetical protein